MPLGSAEGTGVKRTASDRLSVSQSITASQPLNQSATNQAPTNRTLIESPTSFLCPLDQVWGQPTPLKPPIQ